MVKRWRKDPTESHVWVSILAKPRRSHFKRVQRASCCLSVLLTSMFADAMFYKLEGKSVQAIQMGPLTFSWKQVVIGIESAVIVTPINLLTVFLFQRGAEKSSNDNNRCPKATLLRCLAWFLFVCSCAISSAFSIFYSLCRQTGNRPIPSPARSRHKRHQISGSFVVKKSSDFAKKCQVAFGTASILIFCGYSIWGYVHFNSTRPGRKENRLMQLSSRNIAHPLERRLPSLFLFL